MVPRMGCEILPFGPNPCIVTIFCCTFFNAARNMPQALLLEVLSLQSLGLRLSLLRQLQVQVFFLVPDQLEIVHLCCARIY